MFTIGSAGLRKLGFALAASTVLAVSIGMIGNAGLMAAHAQPVKLAAPAQQGFGDVVEKVTPAVVSVRVKGTLEPVSDDLNGRNFGAPGFDDLPEDHPMKRFFREFGRPDADRRADRPRERQQRPRAVSQGSGFFISEDGYVVTNNHVVENGSEFVVVMNDGTELDAKLIGKDAKTDLAVLKVNADRKFTYVAFDTDKSSRVGDWVVAVGNPFGLGGTVTAGIVSALGRDIGAGPYDDFMQIDAAVNRGNSGGPAFNLEGEVVGVNTAIFSPSGGNVGIAFAIPASTASQVVDELMKGGSINRGWLGVQIQPVTSDIAESLGLANAKGALINEVQPEGPAFKAGLEVGDVVIRLDGQSIEDPKDLARKVAAIKPETATEVIVWRDGAEKTLSVSIQKLKETASSAAPEVSTPEAVTPKQLAELGIKAVPNDKGKGVVITDVEPSSVVGERGLNPGDVIVSVNGNEVNAPADLANQIGNAAKSGRKAALVQVEGDRGSRFIAIPVDQG